MPDLRRARGWARWIVLGIAAAVFVLFLLAQRQSVAVSYGQSPSAGGRIAEGSAGELSAATVPSAEEMTALVKVQPVVRLPGAVARWDTERVGAAIAGADIRIIVAPPGLDEAERDRVRAVKEATVRVIGTQVTGGFYQSSHSTVPEWRAEFATGDVTATLVSLIFAIREEDEQLQPAAVTQWREPTSAELAPMVTGLRSTGRFTAPGATLTELPKAVTTAFPDRAPLVAALPRQPFGEPLPHYGRALQSVFPDTPILVMYGDWIEYSGPQAADFAELAAVTFYAQSGDRISRYAYPQRNVLGAYLGRVTDLRYAGLFERPLPYVPFDPVRVGMPALPWLFAACVLVFLLLSVRPVARPTSRWRPTAGPARLAALAALAVEQSALTGRSGDPALTRGITQLSAARAALDDNLPERHVQRLLDAAEAELDESGRSLPFPGYRPGEYLRGGPS
ncbi:hypothetical protein JIG36_35150 [Actinoplanes sp. LDG1-06]|uniref:DUF4350 domain-containing protein n=1 Tax=Paractinoplanes ovalisporus TaxID=2810368 RepID=A0ABS2ANE8_9ACTN|nr:hypothetical protein [Actinoplanes ovalisporus]MBM2620751.1 hypothetical protein [Actinoplanes ovalisporus]